MAVLSLSKSDILRSKIVKAGWHPVTVKKVNQEPAKSDGGASMNHVIDFEIDEGEFAGVPLRTWISEKAPGTGMSFLRGCGFKISEDGGDFDLDKTMGKKLMARVETREFKGNFQNSVVDFRVRA